MKLISLGKIDEKFFLYSYVYIIIKIILNGISTFLKIKEVVIQNLPLILIINNSSNIFFCIPEYFINKALSKKEIVEKKDIKNDNKILYLFRNPKKESNIKNIILLIFVILLNYIYIGFIFSFQIQILKQKDLVYIENLRCIDLLFLFLFLKFFDKKLFYRHHFISLIIILISGLGRHFMKMFIKNKFKDFNFLTPIVLLIFPFIDSIFFYSIQKFMKNTLLIKILIT